MTLELSYLANTPLPVEIEGLTPDWTRDKSLAEIERFELYHGNAKTPLAEMFKVAGDPADGAISLDGNLAGVHWIGAHMRSGQITVHGPAGRHLGSEMAGGELRVHGNVGDWAGAEMHGGLIHVHGSAGHSLGGAYTGSPRGMTGGTILVDGDAGDEVGRSMRRGTIGIRGSAGDLVGYNMRAGTVLVAGVCGRRPGAGMRRGTLCLLGAAPPRLAHGFRYACTARFNVVAMMLRQLQSTGLSMDQSLLKTEFELHSGDVVTRGKGEIFVPTGMERRVPIVASEP